MFRIDGPGATNDNKFTEGDPANGTRATVVSDEWLNAVQEELAKAIEDDGYDLDKLDPGQLSKLIRRRTIYVGSVSELMAIPSPVDKQLYNLTSYHGGWNVAVQRPKGGGEFAWDASRPKADHNGGTIIDPSRTYPANWNDDTQKATWFAVNATTGAGCYVRTKDVAWLSDYGGKVDDTTNDTISLQSAINAEWKVIIDEGRTRYDGVSINKNNFVLEGVGYARSILALNTGDFVGVSVADTVTTSGITLADFMIQGGPSNVGGITLGDGSFSVAASKQKINNVLIDGFSNATAGKGFGIKFRSNQNTDIENAWIQNCKNSYHRTNEGYQTSTRIHGKDSYAGRGTGYGLLIEGQCDDIVLDGITIEGNDLSAIFLTNSAVKTGRGSRLWIKNTYFEANLNGGVNKNVVDIQGGTLSNQQHKVSINSCNFAADPNAPADYNQLSLDRAYTRIADTIIDPSKIETTATCYTRFDSNRSTGAGNNLLEYRSLLGSVSSSDFAPPNQSDDPDQANLVNAITFPSSPRMVSDPKTLDDYEEGSYTPTLTNVSGTISSVTGSYVKVGKTVTLRIVIQGTGISVATDGGGNVSAPTNVQSVSAGTAMGVVPHEFLGGVYVTPSDDTLRLPSFAANDLVIINATYDWSE